jgi:hypothetical protein
MKKAILFALILIAAGAAFGQTELWQGFTDDMSREDVLNRADILFGKDIEIKYDTNSASLRHRHIGDDLQKAISWDLPMPRLEIVIRIKNPDNLQNLSGLRNVSFYFFESKLMYISVGWGGTDNELLPIITRQFGTPKTIQYIQENIFGNKTTFQAYRWENQGRTIFLEFGYILYFNQNFNKEYNDRLAEEKRKKQEIEEAEQARRRNALNDIKL